MGRLDFSEKRPIRWLDGRLQKTHPLAAQAEQNEEEDFWDFHRLGFFVKAKKWTGEKWRWKETAWRDQSETT